MDIDEDTLANLMGVARITAHRYGFHDEDSIATGYLIVSKCINLYDEQKGAELRTYTITALNNEFRHLRRKAGNDVVTIVDPSLLDGVEEESIDTSSAVVVTTQIIQSLPRKYRRIVTDYWIKGKTQRVIAVANKVSTSKINRILSHAMELMRKYNESS